MRLTSAVVGQAVARTANLKALQRALDDLQTLQDGATEENETGADVRVLRESRIRAGLGADNLCRRREIQESPDPRIIGRSSAIRRVLAQLQQVAATDSTVLLLGETGTGKELLATQLHGLSARRVRPMVRVNCAAIPATLMESELFGREKGAFTGALARQIGRFELAASLDDFPRRDRRSAARRAGEAAARARRAADRAARQPEGRFDVDVADYRRHAPESRAADREGAFREDLFYRLNVFPIQVPPLRERVEDIPLLVWRFVDEFSKAFGKRIDAIPRENMAALQQYAWPGNIRELRNVVERAMIVATGTHADHCPAHHGFQSREAIAAPGCRTSRRSTSAACSRATSGAFAASGRGRAARAAADHARDAHGQARAHSPEAVVARASLRIGP